MPTLCGWISRFQKLYDESHKEHWIQKKCTFQTKLMSGIKKINESNEFLIPAGKWRNIYIMHKDDYSKYVRDSVTKTYKRSTTNGFKNINYKSTLLAEKLAINGRIEKWRKQKVISLSKITKKVFPTNCHFRLINPSKFDIGKISKKLLD